MTTNYAKYLLDDFTLRDDLQQIVLVNQITKVTVTGLLAKQRNLNFRETQLGGSLGLEPQDQVFDIGCSDLGQAVPNRGDLLVAQDRTNWTVISATLYSVAGTGIYYSCIVRKQL